MQDTLSSARADRFNLWGLVQSETDPVPGSDKHNTFCIRANGNSGILAFASALDAEIYCHQLGASGAAGWQRAPLQHIDLERIMSGLPDAERRLMLALGFFASDTNDLLLDDDRTLITPLLPIPYRMEHSLHGISQLHINAEVCHFVEQWWEQVGGDQFSEQMRMAETWSDLDLARCATAALSKAPFTEMRRYSALWKETGSGDECAVFSPTTGDWHFSTLRGPRPRSLH